MGGTSLLERWFAAGDAGDLDVFDDVLDPRVVVHAPMGLSTEGPAAEKEVWRDARRAMPDIGFPTAGAPEERDRVAVLLPGDPFGPTLLWVDASTGGVMAGFPALGHVAVTVTDLDRSREWYRKLFGSDPVLDEDTGSFYHVVFALGGGGLFGLHTHPAPNDQPDFSEYRSGLDHVAFAVDRRSELESWQQRLEELGIGHGGIVDAPYGSGLSFRDPDNIALEFFAPPS